MVLAFDSVGQLVTLVQNHPKQLVNYLTRTSTTTPISAIAISIAIAMVHRPRQTTISSDKSAAEDVSAREWSELSVPELVGTELEWSTITQSSRATLVKMKQCLFCGYNYTWTGASSLDMEVSLALLR